MIKLKLDEMLENRGMSAYALHIKSGKKLHQSVISKIKNNDSKALQLDTLDMLCELLNCQPADLIVYESGNATQSVNTTQTENATQNASTTQIVERATHSAKHTQSANTTQFASDKVIESLPELPEGDKWLKTKDIAERLGIKALSTVRDFYNNQGLAHTRVGMVNYVKESDLTAFLDKRAAREKSKP